MDNNIASTSLAKVKLLASQDSSDYLANIMKGTTNGVITGGVLGLAVGFYKKYNLYGSTVAGMVVGGIVANFLIKYKN
jgi:uncharacterized protein YcfJ